MNEILIEIISLLGITLLFIGFANNLYQKYLLVKKDELENGNVLSLILFVIATILLLIYSISINDFIFILLNGGLIIVNVINLYISLKFSN